MPTGATSTRDEVGTAEAKQSEGGVQFAENAGISEAVFAVGLGGVEVEVDVANQKEEADEKKGQEANFGEEGELEVGERKEGGRILSEVEDGVQETVSRSAEEGEVVATEGAVGKGIEQRSKSGVGNAVGKGIE